MLVVGFNQPRDAGQGGVNRALIKRVAVWLASAVAAVLAIDGPAYLRLGKKGEPAVHREPPRFSIGKAILLRPGRDVCARRNDGG